MMTAPEPISIMVSKYVLQCAAFAAVAIAPVSWLPNDPMGAFVLGVIGGLLRWSVTRVAWTQGLVAVATSCAVAVFANGISIPGLSEFVPADSLWRVNTLILAFIGVAALGVFNDLWERVYAKKEIAK